MGKIGYGTLKNLCSKDKRKVDESFSVIFNKYKNLVYFVSFDILHSQEESEDIVEDTFLKMYERRSYFMSESQLKYYLLVTAKNTSINRYNESKKHLAYSDDIHGVTEQNGISIYLDKFKEMLDETEYQYLVLHLLYDFSFKEISKVNGLTVSQVSSKYQRGIKKLRDYYGENMK